MKLSSIDWAKLLTNKTTFIMKKTWLLYMLLLSVLFAACDNTEDLTPSLKDTDRVATQIDMSKPLIKTLKDDFNLGLLYEYDNIFDFAYTAETDAAADVWGSVEIPQMKSRFLDEDGNFPAENVSDYQLYVDAALTFVDTTLFKYFDANGLIASKMPYKVLLSESIFANKNVQQKPIIESDSRIGSSSENGLRIVYNKHSIVIKVNQDDVKIGTSDYIKDNFYVFLSRIMDMHNLYELVPLEFYEGKNEYYGQVMDSIYRYETERVDKVRVDIVDKNWFYSKGFVDAKYFYGTSSGLGTVYQSYDEDGNRLSPSIKHLKGIRPSYNFVAGLNEDVRSYLNEMIHRDAAEIDAFPDNIKDNMRLLIGLFEGWGVKIVEFNPALEVLNN